MLSAVAAEGGFGRGAQEHPFNAARLPWYHSDKARVDANHSLNRVGV